MDEDDEMDYEAADVDMMCDHADCIAIRVLGANFAKMIEVNPVFPLMLGVIMTVRECDYTEAIVLMLDYLRDRILDLQLDEDIAQIDIDAEIEKLLKDESS